MGGVRYDLSLTIDEGAQRRWGADNRTAAAEFYESARLEALQHRADGVA